MANTFHLFSEFSRLKPNLSKWEITSIGALKGVQVAVCGMRCVDLKNHTLKILGTYFSYNEKLKEERNFYTTVTSIQRVLKIWKTRNLKLEGKIAIFKTALLNFIQTYFSREIKINFFHLSIRKSFYTGKTILPENLKYHLPFCLIIYGTMKISR